MKREEARANLVALGVTEPTEEQITNYLNQFASETNSLKTQVAEAQKNAQNVADLQKQLKELQDSKLTDEERAEKEQKEKDDKILELENQVKAMELKGKLAEQGITGEDADKLIASSNGGSLDVELLGQIIKARETEAAQKKEKEIADKSTNPNGGNGGSGDDVKSDDVAFAEKLANSFGTKPSEENKNIYAL